MRQRGLHVTFTLVALLLTPLSAAPVAASDEGATGITYTPAGADAKAFVFDVRMNEATECVRYRYSAEMDFGEPLPWIESNALSRGTILVEGREVVLPTRSLGGYFEMHPQTGDEHLMVNASVGDMPVHRTYEERGYDKASRVVAFSSESGVCDLSCRALGFVDGASACTFTPTYDTVSFRLEVIMTPRVRNVEFRFEFYEEGAWNSTSNRYEGTHGDARGSIVFASESNRTFLKQLKDFDGTASYNGDPLGTGLVSSGGVNLHTKVATERGMIGGFADVGWQTATDLLSYVGPAGEAGVVSDGSHSLIFTRMMDSFSGSPGTWTFNAHLYQNPDYATLWLWGADIDVGAPDPGVPFP